MSTQLVRNSEAAPILSPGACLAAALLIVLLSTVGARAASFSQLVITPPVAGAELFWSSFEATVTADQVPSSDSHEPDFGTAGLAVTGPFAAADGESGGMVFCWTAMARDPAYLVTATSLISTGGRSWIAPDQSLWTLPDVGVVPGGNLSVFDTGAVDVISWNFLEYSSALLALRLEEYIHLSEVLDPGDLDLDARVPELGGWLSPVPDPTTSLLMGQGLLILALLGPRR